MVDLNYITATELNRGKSSKSLKDVHENNKDLLVIKQSTPYAVIISYERYQKLIKGEVDYGRQNN